MTLGRSAVRRFAPNESPSTQPSSKPAKPAHRQAHAELTQPIWLEHLSRDIQRFISQLANAVAQQALYIQTQSRLIWRHYPAGKRLVPHRK
jgi:hypothetical protein